MAGSFKSSRFISQLVGVALLATSAALSSACNNGSGSNLIERVVFSPSANLETIRLSLVFGQSVKTDLAGGFMLKDYGFLFVNPYTLSEPFEVGFSLNTAIFNDQDYLNIVPTAVLPNGVPIGLDFSLIEIRSKDPISSKFDLYGYVDLYQRSWMGAAAIFSFINDQYFPNGISVSQAFLRNEEGKPAVLASVFGPSVNGDGTVKRAGGIAVFANIRQLFAKGLLNPGKVVSVYADRRLPTVEGENAERYRNNPQALIQLENNLIRAFNQKQ